MNSANVPRCKLDSFQCLSLSQVVNAFSNPINQEHAWALVYQGVTCFLRLSGRQSTTSSSVCYLVRGMGDIMISKEGFVHPNTFIMDEGREFMTSMATGIAELGVAVYDALDWSLSKDVSVERNLSLELENALDVMTSADDVEVLDEGIGEEEVISRLCEKVLNMCRHHLAMSYEADDHYQQVCRALVVEAMELSNFMDNLSKNDSEELENLDRQEWAGIFNQVMSEIRNGIELKAIDFTRVLAPIEFALTPYEMLMYDIKSKKAVLKPAIPVHVEKAAKEKILEAIRSRPPLKSVDERILRSSKKDEETPIENLMNEIKRGTARMSLRKTRISNKSNSNEIIGRVVDDVMKTNKRVIDLDETFATTICNFEESPDNSIVVPSSPESVQGDGAVCTVEDDRYGNPNENVEHENYIQADDSLHSQDLCRLSLEEVGHIRSQITLADMERQDMSKQTRKDYAKGRICFQCAKTKFNMFHWAYACQLCKKSVCKSCINTIRLPSLKLADIPVSSLKSQFKEECEVGFKEKKSSFGEGWQRSSLKLNRNTVKQDHQNFARSKTVTKAEIEHMREKAYDAAISALGIDHTVCIGCKDLLASMVSGKKGTKSPRKKSIHDLQTVTISKRKS